VYWTRDGPGVLHGSGEWRFDAAPRAELTEHLLFASGKPRAVTGVDDDRGDEDGSDADTDATPDPATDWRAALAATGRLTPAIVDAIVSTHGSRGQQAIEAVSEGRVKQYKDFTVVVGHDDEYIVEDGQCTCKDAEYNLAPDDPDQRCWHSLAVDVAEGVGRVDHHDMWYSEVREFL
jgi:predicted nucleic acid-binding Zn finger protein